MRKLLLFIASLSLSFSGLRCTRPKAGEDGVEAASPLLLFSTSSFHPGKKVATQIVRLTVRAQRGGEGGDSEGWWCCVPVPRICRSGSSDAKSDFQLAVIVFRRHSCRCQ